MPRKKAAPHRNVATAADAKRAREEADKAAADAARKRARSDKDAWAFKQNVTSVDAPLRDTDGDGVEVARLVGVRDPGDASASFHRAANPTRIALEVSGDRVKTARLAWSFAGEDDENEDAWRPERAPSFDVATALLFLLDRGRFALRLVDRDATRCVLAVLVAPDALDAPTHPEELARKAHHAKQRSALAWLAPPPRGTLERYAAGIDGEKGVPRGVPTIPQLCSRRWSPRRITSCTASTRRLSPRGIRPTYAAGARSSSSCPRRGRISAGRWTG